MYDNIWHISIMPLYKSFFNTFEEAKSFIANGFDKDGIISSLYEGETASCYNHTLMLFQFHAEIIGCGIYEFKRDNLFGYVHYFNPDTVFVFEETIKFDELQKIVIELKTLNAKVQKIDRKYNEELIELINKRISNSQIEGTTVVYDAKEGGKKTYYTTKYERNKKYREEAVRVHGLSCEICSFNFVDTYGDIGRNYIEVHHVKPLFSLNEEVIPDVNNDMICVCANCHRMLHRNKYSIISPNELRNIILNTKK